jgi:hypothetical protein
MLICGVILAQSGLSFVLEIAEHEALIFVFVAVFSFAVCGGLKVFFGVHYDD